MSTNLKFSLKLDMSNVLVGLKKITGKIDGTLKKVSKPMVMKANVDGAVSAFGKLGLAMNGIKSIYGMLNRSVGEFLTLSNTQEKAESDMVAALSVKGEATLAEIKRMKDYASAIQSVTTIGDEETLGLITLATNMGIAQEKRKEATTGAIGLAKAFEAAGLTQKTAMKGLALAYEGDYTQLQRYIPALKSAETETEKMAVLQENMANGFTMAKEETKTGAGAMTQYSNLIGDLKEKIGDMIKTALLPILSVLSKVAIFLNKHPAMFKAVAAAIGIVVGALSAWKIVQMALNITMAANPIGIVVVAVGALVAAIMIGIDHIGGFSVAWGYAKASMLIVWEYMKAFGNYLYEFGSSAIQILTYPFTVMFRTVKNIFSNISELLDALFSGDFSKIGDILSKGFTDGFNETNASISKGFENSMNAFTGLGEKAKKIWGEVKKQTASTESAQPNSVEAESVEPSQSVEVKSQHQIVEEKLAVEQEYAQESIVIVEDTNDEKAEIREAAWELEQMELEREDPYQARLNRQKQATIDWFAEKHDLLIKSGLSEVKIQKKQSKALQALEDASMALRIKTGAKGLGQMASNFAGFGKTGFEISKALNIAQVVMETPAAAMAAYKSVVGIPVIGPMLAPIAFGATIAQGAMSISQIASASPPKAEKGGLSGLLAGNSHANGGVIIEAEGDEYITNKRRVGELGVGLFDFLNFAPLSSVKNALSGLAIPSMSGIPSPKAVMAGGGSVGGSNSDSKILSALADIKRVILDKNMSVKNTINVELDGEDIAEKVTQTQEFENGRSI